MSDRFGGAFPALQALRFTITPQGAPAQPFAPGMIPGMSVPPAVFTLPEEPKEPPALQYTNPVITLEGVTRDLGMSPSDAAAFQRLVGDMVSNSNPATIQQQIVQYAMAHGYDPSLRRALLQRSINYFKGGGIKRADAKLRADRSRGVTPAKVKTGMDLDKARLVIPADLSKGGPGSGVKGHFTNAHQHQFTDADKVPEYSASKERKKPESWFRANWQYAPNGKDVITSHGVKISQKQQSEAKADEVTAKRHAGTIHGGHAILGNAGKHYIVKEGEQDPRIFSSVQAAKNAIDTKLALRAELGTHSSVEKAEPRGGKYHARIPAEDGKHRYIYSEDKYNARPDAHLRGSDVLRGRLRKDILDRVGSQLSGPGIALDDLSALHDRYDPGMVTDMVKELMDAGSISQQDGKLSPGTVSKGGPGSGVRGHTTDVAHPKHMRGSQINAELDKLDKKIDVLTAQFIAAGRGDETATDSAKKTDPLSVQDTLLRNRRADLRNEIAVRYGPGAPSRLPKGVGASPREQPDTVTKADVEEQYGSGGIGSGGDSDGDDADDKKQKKMDERIDRDSEGGEEVIAMEKDEPEKEESDKESPFSKARPTGYPKQHEGVGEQNPGQHGSTEFEPHLPQPRLSIRPQGKARPNTTPAGKHMPTGNTVPRGGAGSHSQASQKEVGASAPSELKEQMKPSGGSMGMQKGGPGSGVIGHTSSGKEVTMGSPESHAGFTSKDHEEATQLHLASVRDAKKRGDKATADKHYELANAHDSAGGDKQSAEKYEEHAKQAMSATSPEDKAKHHGLAMSAANSIGKLEAAAHHKAEMEKQHAIMNAAKPAGFSENDVKQAGYKTFSAKEAADKAAANPTKLMHKKAADAHDTAARFHAAIGSPQKAFHEAESAKHLALAAAVPKKAAKSMSSMQNWLNKAQPDMGDGDEDDLPAEQQKIMGVSKPGKAKDHEDEKEEHYSSASPDTMHTEHPRPEGVSASAAAASPNKPDLGERVEKGKNKKDPVHTQKFDRAVQHIKDSGKVDNPYAVAMSALGPEEAVRAKHRQEKSMSSMQNWLSKAGYVEHPRSGVGQGDGIPGASDDADGATEGKRSLENTRSGKGDIDGIPGAEDDSEGKGPLSTLKEEDPEMEEPKSVNGGLSEAGEEGGDLEQGAGTGARLERTGPGKASTVGDEAEASEKDTGEEQALSEDDGPMGKMKEGEPGFATEKDKYLEDGHDQMDVGSMDGKKIRKGSLDQYTGVPSAITETHANRIHAMRSQRAQKSDDVAAGYGKGKLSKSQPGQQKPLVKAHNGAIYSDASDLAVERMMKGEADYYKGGSAPRMHNVGPAGQTIECSMCKSDIPAYLTTCPMCGVKESVFSPELETPSSAGGEPSNPAPKGTLATPASAGGMAKGFTGQRLQPRVVEDVYLPQGVTKK